MKTMHILLLANENIYQINKFPKFIYSTFYLFNHMEAYDLLFSGGILIVYVFILVYTVKLVNITKKSSQAQIKQQKIVSEMNVLPKIHFVFFQQSAQIFIQVETNIAEDLKGEIWVEANESPEKIPIGEIKPTTAVPSPMQNIVTVKDFHIKEKLQEFGYGDTIRIKADMTYRSIIGGEYNSLHSLLLEKNKFEGPFVRVESCVKYNQKPW